MGMGLIQVVITLVIILLLVKPVGHYLVKVFSYEKSGQDRIFGPIERGIYRLIGVRGNEAMGWKKYIGAMLLTNFVMLLILFAVLKLQKYLPFNPDGIGNMPTWLAFNTASSFITNTNWQSYSGENALSYFSQMAAIIFPMFTSAATGFAFLSPERKARITLEAFYKRYDRYPFSVAQGVSLANLGSDFNVVGNEAVTPTSEGRAYGVEFLYQQRLFKGVYGLLAYTFFRSEFTDAQGVYQPSAWDFRHSLSLTAGWRFGKAWELSGRFLFSGGAPYTPYDLEASAQKANWDANKQGVPDYSRLNSERTADFHQLDVRITKQFYFNRWSIELYLDIQNLYGYKVRLRDNFDVLRDDQGQPLTDPNNPDAYQYRLLKNESGVTLPSIGVVVDF